MEILGGNILTVAVPMLLLLSICIYVEEKRIGITNPPPAQPTKGIQIAASIVQNMLSIPCSYFFTNSLAFGDANSCQPMTRRIGKVPIKIVTIIIQLPTQLFD